MSDTPETDKQAVGVIGFYSCATVPADFARKLERERDEAQEKVKNQDERIRFLEWATNHPYGTTLTEALRERDEARIQYRSTLALAEALANTQIKLVKERDEALKKAAA